MSAKWSTSRLGLLAVVTFASQQAHAYTPLALIKPGSPEQVGWLYWQQLRDSQPIPYRISSVGTPDVSISTADPAIDEFEAMQLAFAAWQQVTAGVPIQFSISSTSTNQYGYDGQNVIFFADLGDVGYGGVTLITFDNTTGQILDADIHMNDHNILWLTSLNEANGEPLPCPCQGSDAAATYTNDIQGLATHEIGHALGLDHSGVGYREFVSTPTMYPLGIWNVPDDGTRPPNSRYRTVELDDRIGVASLYPPLNWSAQAGEVHGIVHDRSDAPLFGAHVVARNVATGVEVGAMSGVLNGAYQSDAYRIRGLPAGTYQIRAEPLIGAPPGYVSRYNFGGINQAVIPAKFPDVVDFATMYHKLVFDGGAATAVAQSPGVDLQVDFRPIARIDRLPRFARIPHAFSFNGFLNVDVTGPLSQAQFVYSVDQAVPVSTNLPVGGGAFSVPVPQLPAGSLVKYHVSVVTNSAANYQTQQQALQMGLSNKPLVFVDKNGSGRVSVVDTKTMFEIDETEGLFSFPAGLAFHSAKFGLYVANYGYDRISFLSLADGRLPPVQPLAFDTDGDGLLNVLETNVFSTNPGNPDSDGDLSLDGAEISEQFYVDPGAGTNYFELRGGTAASNGTTRIGSPYLNIAIFDLTANGWASGAITLTPSGRYRLRLPADGHSYQIVYYNAQTLQFITGTSGFSGTPGAVVSGGLTTVNLPAPNPLIADTGTNPLDATEGGIRIFLPGPTDITMPDGADVWGLALSPDQKWLFATANGTNSVYRIDTQTHLTTHTAIVGTHPKGIAVTSDGAKVLVASIDGMSVTVLNANNLTLVNTIPLGRQAHYVAVIPGNRAIVTTDGGDDFAVIDTATNSLQSNLASGMGGLYFLAAGAPPITTALAGPFQVGSHSLAVLDLQTLTASTIDLGATINATSGLALHPDGQHGYAIHYLNPELVEFAVSNGEISRRVAFDYVDIRDIGLVDCVPCTRGDMNGDCFMNLADVPGFVAALQADTPPCPTFPRGDMNGDGRLDGTDIDEFTDTLLGQ